MGPSEYPHFAATSPKMATDKNHEVDRLRSFRDSYYTGSGLLDHLNSDGFDCRSDRPRGFFTGARLGLGLATALTPCLR